MPLYEIEQYEIHTVRFQVEAASEADAIAKLFVGEAEVIDNSMQFIELAEELGMPVEEYAALAEELTKLGVEVGDVVIPSIRAVLLKDESPE